jgi:hypothetical protein|tara:strand:+ start:3078 stop:3476 length:399 start_codon:yes stop_codon:yes gene_type:complete
MIKEEKTILGNEDDLKNFVQYLLRHDEKTVRSYYRIAKKKNSFLVIRKFRTADPQTQLFVVPYRMAEKSSVRDAIKGKIFHHTGRIRSVPYSAKIIFAFGEIVEKNDEGEIDEFLPQKYKRKPKKKKENEND